MRERINWMKRLKKTIPDIEDYDNLYTLKCAQGGYLTKDNIVQTIMERNAICLTKR